MNHLILVKHSLPEIIPGVTAAEWRLGEEGRRRCRPLAEKLAAYRPQLIFSSEEPKAVETAELVAAQLEMPWQTAVNLHEHERRDVPFQGEEEWQRAMADFFARPEALVLGQETAVAAGERFDTAVRQIIASQPGGNIVIVAHGTVITLWVNRYNTAVAPFTFWQQLELPSLVVASLPDFHLVEPCLPAG